MGNEWTENSIGEILEHIADNRGKNPQSYCEMGIPVIDNYLITSDWRIDLTKTRRCIDTETYDSFIRKHIKEDDVLVTLVGNGYGSVAITPKEKCVIIQNTIGLRCNPENDNKFLYYLLKGNRESLMNLNIGAAQPSIKVGNLLDLSFEFPPLSEQKAIAHILGSLDDKIELNRKMNETLEEMAKALFKSWFVDFDPVIDNILRKNLDRNQVSPDLAKKEESTFEGIPEDFRERAEVRLEVLGERSSRCVSSGEDGAGAPSLPDFHNLPNIGKLFPSAFRESEELGWIPDGWEVKPLDKIANFKNGLALQKFRPKKDEIPLPVVKIAQLNAGKATWDETASPNITPECIIDDGDVVFSWSGTLVIDIWCGGKAALNQHLFKVTSDQYPKWFYFGWSNEHLNNFQRIAEDKAVTMGHIKRSHLASAFCAVPNEDLLAYGSGILSPIIGEILEKRGQIQTLSNLRDTLLPKLISGEHRLTEVAQFTEEALA